VFARNKWPDYVFSSEYKRMSLSEVEKYINTHKHLPGMPTAEEVEKEGIQVGDINTILVEKVEELTLHAIEHEKLIQAQKELIEVQQKQNAELRSLMEVQNKRIEKLETK
jgi:hypothetical protein